MEHLFAILLGWITAYLILRTIKQFTANNQAVKDCIHHKWEYKDRGDGVEALFCKNCNKWAGIE